eukprot:2410695-Rhodomonas_salina.1
MPARQYHAPPAPYPSHIRPYRARQHSLASRHQQRHGSDMAHASTHKHTHTHHPKPQPQKRGSKGRASRTWRRRKWRWSCLGPLAPLRRGTV